MRRPALRSSAKDFSYRDWYNGVTRTGSNLRVLGSSNPRLRGTLWSLAVAAPIRAPARRSGVRAGHRISVVGYQLTAIQQFVTSFEQGQAVALTVTDQRGVILATPRPRPGLVSAAQDPRVRRALAGQAGIVSINTHGGRILSASRPSAVSAGRCIADVSEATAFACANRLRLTVGAVAGALGMVLFLAAWLLGRLWRERSAAEAEVRALNVGLETRVTERTADLQRANQNLEAFSLLRLT